MKYLKIKTGHTYQEYIKKYGKKFNKGKLEFIKLGNEKLLSYNKKYWLIKDEKPGYYQVNRLKFLIPIIYISLGTAATATAVVVPLVLLSPSSNYSFTFNGTNCELNNANSYAPNTELDLTLSVNDGFDLPNSLAIKIDDFIQTAGTDYTYNKVDSSNASLKLKMTGNVIVDALAPEKGLVLSFDITPKSGENKLGFAFQCVKDSVTNTNKSIMVDWGDGSNKETLTAPDNIDNVVAPNGFADLTYTNCMWYYAAMSMQGSKPASLPTSNDFSRHTYATLNKPYTVKIYGELNNIAFAFPNPYNPELFPWGTANVNIDNIVTYRELPALNINSQSGSSVLGIDLDQQVVFSSDNLTKATFALGTTKINNGCLCTSQKLKSVSIPETVTEIGDTAFSRCHLDKISIPSSVTKIGYEAFFTHIDQVDNNKQQLKNGVIFGNNSQLKKIGNSAFKSAGFNSFDLPDSVEILGDTVFAQCVSLSEINISNNSSLKEIGNDCFGVYDGVCTHPAIHDLYIPAGVNSIGDYAFEFWGFDPNDPNNPPTQTFEQYVHILGCQNETEADTKFATDNPDWRNGVRTTGTPVIVYGH